MTNHKPVAIGAQSVEELMAPIRKRAEATAEKVRPTAKRLDQIQRLIEMNQKGKSLKEAAEALGVHQVTVSKWVRTYDVPVIRHGRKKEPEKWVEIACDQCGKKFSIQRSQKRRFCSRDCTNQWQRTQVEARTCEGCGNPLEVQPGAKTMYTYRKFCSDECRAKYGGKRQRDPSKWKTFVCRNCGEEFEQRKSSQSYGKYCSNACAYRHTKTKEHIVVEDAVVLDSKWEALFWGLLGFLKIPCERYDRAGAVEYAPGCWYAPDFLLSKSHIAIEVKGNEDDDDPEKWDFFRAQRGQLAVVDQEMLETLRMLNREQIIARLHRLATEQAA